MGTTSKPTTDTVSWDVLQNYCNTHGRSYTYGTPAPGSGGTQLCHTTSGIENPSNSKWDWATTPAAERNHSLTYRAARGSPIPLPSLKSVIITNTEVEALRARLNTEQTFWGLNNTTESLDAAATNTDKGITITSDLVNRIIGKLNSITARAGVREYWNKILDDSVNLSSIPQGEIIDAQDWRVVVQRFNLVVNNCVCNRNCGCNWVCSLYQACRCNGYYKACPAAFDNIVDNTAGRATP